MYFWLVPLNVNKQSQLIEDLFETFLISRGELRELFGAMVVSCCVQISHQTTIKLWYPVSPFPTLRQDGRPQGEVLSCKNVLH